MVERFSEQDWLDSYLSEPSTLPRAVGHRGMMVQYSFDSWWCPAVIRRQEDIPANHPFAESLQARLPYIGQSAVCEAAWKREDDEWDEYFMRFADGSYMILPLQDLRFD